jgi:hypothetical protein
MAAGRTIRISTITHAQAIRLPGHEVNSIQIDGIDQDGNPVRIILEPPVLKAMLEPVLEQKNKFGIDR